jgi:excisionase family DNA binding protein
VVTPYSKTKQYQAIGETHGITNPARKRLFSLKEAAEYLGRSEWGMRELAWAGRIPVVKPEGGRKIFFDILDLMEFIEKNKSRYL